MLTKYHQAGQPAWQKTHARREVTTPSGAAAGRYSTVTDLARLRGLSTSRPSSAAM